MESIAIANPLAQAVHESLERVEPLKNSCTPTR